VDAKRWSWMNRTQALSDAGCGSLTSRDMLQDLADLVPVHAMSEAMQVLEHDPVGIDHLHANLSDHNMMEVKGNPKTSAIPIFGLPGARRAPVRRAGGTHGRSRPAIRRAFFNLPRFPADEARRALGAAVMK
jgi:hypothetical protein